MLRTAFPLSLNLSSVFQIFQAPEMSNASSWCLVWVSFLFNSMMSTRNILQGQIISLHLEVTYVWVNVPFHFEQYLFRLLAFPLETISSKIGLSDRIIFSKFSYVCCFLNNKYIFFFCVIFSMSRNLGSRFLQEIH